MRKVVVVLDKEILSLPVLSVSLWEDVDEDGFVVDEGYTYQTPYGKVITRETREGEEVLHADLKVPAKTD